MERVRGAARAHASWDRGAWLPVRPAQGEGGGGARAHPSVVAQQHQHLQLPVAKQAQRGRLGALLGVERLERDHLPIGHPARAHD
eukprot:4250215-Prymnesium_polylepis.2